MTALRLLLAAVVTLAAALGGPYAAAVIAVGFAAAVSEGVRS